MMSSVDVKLNLDCESKRGSLHFLRKNEASSLPVASFPLNPLLPHVRQQEKREAFAKLQRREPLFFFFFFEISLLLSSLFSIYTKLLFSFLGRWKEGAARNQRRAPPPYSLNVKKRKKEKRKE